MSLPQVSVLSPLLTLIYINDLPRDLHAYIKLFADDTLLSSIVDDIDKSASKLNNYPIRIQEWDYQWKISFDIDRTKPAHRPKPAHEVILIWKNENSTYPNLYFNSESIVKSTIVKSTMFSTTLKPDNYL